MLTSKEIFKIGRLQEYFVLSICLQKIKNKKENIESVFEIVCLKFSLVSSAILQVLFKHLQEKLLHTEVCIGNLILPKSHVVWLNI